jgi:hypothetical protein
VRSFASNCIAGSLPHAAQTMPTWMGTRPQTIAITVVARFVRSDSECTYLNLEGWLPMLELINARHINARHIGRLPDSYASGHHTPSAPQPELMEATV